jgi:hypothetical protein
MGAIMRFERKMGEVAYAVGALGRAFEHRCERIRGASSRQRVEVITQCCRLCGLEVEHRYKESDETTADSICDALMQSYDQHECARLSSSQYLTNGGLDELYGRIEALSVECAARALELARDGAPAKLVARAEHESRELARRAKTLEWILAAGAVGSRP